MWTPLTLQHCHILLIRAISIFGGTFCLFLLFLGAISLKMVLKVAYKTLPFGSWFWPWRTLVFFIPFILSVLETNPSPTSSFGSDLFFSSLVVIVTKTRAANKSSFYRANRVRVELLSSSSSSLKSSSKYITSRTRAYKGLARAVIELYTIYKCFLLSRARA